MAAPSGAAILTPAAGSTLFGTAELTWSEASLAAIPDAPTLLTLTELPSAPDAPTDLTITESTTPDAPTDLTITEVA